MNQVGQPFGAYDDLADTYDREADRHWWNGFKFGVVAAFGAAGVAYVIWSLLP